MRVTAGRLTGGDPASRARAMALLVSLPAEFTAQIFVRCPFCTAGQLYVAGEDETGPAAYHEEPWCEEWGRLELCDFLEAARLRMSD
jgi:hypothetical protein